MRRTVSVRGGSVTLTGPRGCIRRGGTFVATLKWKRKKRKGNLFVKVRRTDFYIGTRRVKIDRRAPFRQTLRVRATSRPRLDGPPARPRVHQGQARAEPQEEPVRDVPGVRLS